MSFRFTAFISRNKCNLQSTSRQNDPPFCLMISIWGVYATQFVFFISTTYPPSSEARASSCFDFFFLLLAPDSYFHLEAISPPASNCLLAHLIGQMLRAVNHCGNVCCVRFLISSFVSPASG